jgi:hypothetical protein
VTETDTVGALRPVARAILRYWPIGLAVAVVVGAAGVLVAWEDPTVERSTARVLPPARVVTFAETQQYIPDMEAQLLSPVIQRRAAVESGLREDAIVGRVEVRRRGQSGVLAVTLRTPEPLEAPDLVLYNLATAAGAALAAPDQAAAERRLLTTEERLEQVRDELVAAEQARQASLDAAGGVPAALELPALASEIAALRVCSLEQTGAAAESCAATADDLSARYTELAARADAEAQLEQAVTIARDEEQAAETDQRAAQRAMDEAAAPPTIDVEVLGQEEAQWASLARRVVAALAAAVLAGLAVAALVAWRKGELRDATGAAP